MWNAINSTWSFQNARVTVALYIVQYHALWPTSILYSAFLHWSALHCQYSYHSSAIMHTYFNFHIQGYNYWKLDCLKHRKDFKMFEVCFKYASRMQTCWVILNSSEFMLFLYSIKTVGLRSGLLFSLAIHYQNKSEVFDTKKYSNYFECSSINS